MSIKTVADLVEALREQPQHYPVRVSHESNLVRSVRAEQHEYSGVVVVIR